MCDYCASDPACANPTCARTGSACSCSLSGPPRCPTCGHDCLPWYVGLDLANAPVSINSFLGGAGTENPGFDRYPATKAQLLAAARQEVADSDEPNTADVEWFDHRLPDGTYRDAGEVLSTLWEAPSPPSFGGPEWFYRPRPTSIPLGARLRVPPATVLLLVGRDNQPLDVLPPGDHLVSPTTAPLAAAQARPPAPGFARSVLRSSLVFFSTGDLESPVDYRGRSRTGEPFYVSAKVRCALTDPKKFVASPAGNRTPSSLGTAALGSVLASPALTSSVQARDAAAITSDPSLAESTIRSAFESAGFAVRSVQVEYAGFNPVDRAFAGGARDPFAHLPPEARATMQARLAEAMSRRGGPPPPRPVAGPTAAVPGTPGSAPAVLVCPACRAPNPPAGKFCQSCGSSLAASRKCPACGQDVPPSVKFCGNCGTRMA